MITSVLRAHRRACPSSARRVRGVGLIEVLVALVILAFGLLGIAAMQATSLRNSQSAMERSQAVVQTYSILDRMRANVAVATIGGYDLDWTCAAPAAGTLVGDDWNQWITNLKATLGESACGKIERPDPADPTSCPVASAGCINEFIISVRWDDSRGTSGATNETLVTRTRL